ncbi:MAG: nitrogenase iron-molybdenum cofactor biosynthesis protein NifN [Magnetospirillum sp. WYHS-4]
MTEAPRKACAVNPLKSSAPLGAALAFLGIDGCLPLFHGSQGCTAFALVLMVRHFREAIPLQTTAMNEISTILGGSDNVEQALVNIVGRTKPKVIGLCTTALTETRGEDFSGDLRLTLARRDDLGETAVVVASTPDFDGGLETGWSKAVTAMVEQLVPAGPREVVAPRQVNLLAGSHLTPGDVEELREIAESFGLDVILLPDLAGSLDGHVPDRYIPTTYGGTRLEDIRRMGRSMLTLALGEQMRPAAEALERQAGVPFRVLDRLTGLEASDTLVAVLAELSGRPVPPKLRRQRSQLVDAMLDGHFFFGGKSIALAGEPDLLWALGSFLAGLGAKIAVAVATDGRSPLLARLPAAKAFVGDLGDLEDAAAGCHLIVAPAHGRQAGDRLGIPLFRAGFPVFDRLGGPQRVSVGYRGTRELLFAVANLLIEADSGHEVAHDAQTAAG